MKVINKRYAGYYDFNADGSHFAADGVAYFSFIYDSQTGQTSYVSVDLIECRSYDLKEGNEKPLSKEDEQELKELIKQDCVDYGLEHELTDDY